MPRSASVRNDCASATANLQFISIRIFKEECVITWTVFRPDPGTFQVSAAGFTDNLSYVIDLFARFRPECNSRIIRAMIRVFAEAKEFRRFASAVFFKRTPTPPRFYREQIQLPAELWRKIPAPAPYFGHGDRCDQRGVVAIGWNWQRDYGHRPRAVVSSSLIQPEPGALPRCGFAVLLR